MPRYEFKVIPAPTKGKSAKGVRGKADKFAHAVSVVMNEMGAEGWDYVRADTLPCEERQGLTSKVTTYHNLLVFRREIVAETAPDAAETQAQDSAQDPDTQTGTTDVLEAHAELLSRGAPLSTTPPASDAATTTAPALNGASRPATQAD